MTSDSGLTVSYGFDVMDRVTDIVWCNASNDVVRSFEYQFDGAGMITNVTSETGDSRAYTYDEFNQLTGERHISSDGDVSLSAGFAYDCVGNRTQKTRGDSSVSYTLNYGSDGNRLASWILMPAAASPIIFS